LTALAATVPTFLVSWMTLSGERTAEESSSRWSDDS